MENQPANTVLLVSGDSMSEHGLWPAMVSEATGWLVESTARSGQTSTEIALREGALQMTVRVDGASADRAFEVTPLYPITSFRESVAEPMADIEIAGTLAGRPGVLRHHVAATAVDGWSFAPAGNAGDAPPVAGALLTFVPDSRPTPPGSIAAIWCGRNNIGSDVLRDIAAMTDRLTALDFRARFLVLGIVNSEQEPRGTAAHAEIVALNAILARHYGDRYVEVRTPLVGADGTGEDIPPASQRLDIIHLNETGDRVVATAVLERLLALGWWGGATGDVTG